MGAWPVDADMNSIALQGRAKLKAARNSQVAGILMKTVLAMHWPLLLGALALQLAYSGAQFAGPELLNQITQYLQTPRQLQVSELSFSCLQVAAANIIAGCGGTPLMSQAGPCCGLPMPHAVGWSLLLMVIQSAMSHTSDLQWQTSCRRTAAAEIIAVHCGESHSAPVVHLKWPAAAVIMAVTPRPCRTLAAGLVCICTPGGAALKSPCSCSQSMHRASTTVLAAC